MVLTRFLVPLNSNLERNNNNNDNKKNKTKLKKKKKMMKKMMIMKRKKKKKKGSRGALTDVDYAALAHLELPHHRRVLRRTTQVSVASRV